MMRFNWIPFPLAALTFMLSCGCGSPQGKINAGGSGANIQRVAPQEPLEETKRIAESEQIQSADIGPRAAIVYPDCYDLQESNRGDTYYVIFDEQRGSFVYPSTPPLDGEEIVLCLERPRLTTRYRLVFGSRSQGTKDGPQDAITNTTTVGFAPSPTSTSLRTAAARLEKDLTCGTDQLDCEHLRGQVRNLIDTISQIARYRDLIAQLLVDVASAPGNPQAIGALMSLPDSLCATPPQGDRSRSNVGKFPQVVRQNLTLEPNSHPTVVVTFKKAPACAGNNERMTIDAFANTVLRNPLFWAYGEWHVVDHSTASALPSIGPYTDTPPPVISDLKEERARLMGVLQDVLTGYSRLTALSSRIVEDTLRREMLFRIGKFDGDKLVVASLEQYDLTLNYDQDSGALVSGARLSTHALSLVVRPTSWWHLEVGFAGSSGENPAYTLRQKVVDVTTGTTTTPTAQTFVERESDGRFFGPATFVAFHLCAQDVATSIYSRQCAGGHHNWRRYAPSLNIGVPIGKELVEGNLFVGIGLPYIPYVSIVPGIHVYQANGLRDGVASGQQTTATSVDILQEKRLAVGFFLSLNMTSEIFYTLAPTLRPAQ